MTSNAPLINIKQYPITSPYGKLDFSHFIKRKQKDKEISTEELASTVGINYEVFRKIINRDKPTKKRDLIIIICYLLHLEQQDYDDALDRYFMPLIDEDNERDFYLYNTLLSDPNLSIDDINNLLIQQNHSPLDLHNKRKSSNSKAKNLEKVFEEFQESEIQINYDYILIDQYNSLSTTYSPQNYQVSGTSYLNRIKTNKKTIIHIDENDNLYKLDKNHHYNLVKKIDKSNILYSNYTSLLGKIEKERRILLETLNDTKNYGCRTSACYSNNHIVIFSEDFNYTIPELSEYYTVEYYDNTYHYKIYKSSAFMSIYLQNDEYIKTFNCKVPVASEEYTSIDDIATIKEKKTKYGMQYVPYKSRERIFKSLKQNVDNLRLDLINRKVFIQNIDYIYDYPEEVFFFYKIEKDFQCEYDKTYGEISSSSDSATFSLPNGNKIEINKQDIFRAFELGVNNIEDICTILDRYGSIDSLL